MGGAGVGSPASPSPDTFSVFSEFSTGAHEQSAANTVLFSALSERPSPQAWALGASERAQLSKLLRTTPTPAPPARRRHSPGQI